MWRASGGQKEHITAMRMQGIDYSTIAKSLGLKKETVAAFCRKNGLSSVKAADSRVIPSQTDTCPVCGTVLVQIPGRKKCRFCSETAVGNTVPFPAPPSKGAMHEFLGALPLRRAVRQKDRFPLAFSAQACTQMVQYSPRSTPQLRPVYTATTACYLPPSMVICPIQRRRQHEKGNKTAK